MDILKVDLSSADAPKQFCTSIRETGFAVLTNHPVQKQLIDEIYAEWETFFKGDKEHALRNLGHHYNAGYHNKEVAKGATVANLMEYYHYFPWYGLPEGISDKSLDLLQQINDIGQRLLEWLQEDTPKEIREQYDMPLPAMVKDSERTLLRVIHYPPLEGAEEDGAMRAAEHEDIDLLTLLVAATEPGLQVKDSSGNWHDVQAYPGSIVVNSGDMLQMASQGYYTSTTHRVINPTGDAVKKSRMSIPFFLHPHSHVRLSETHTAESYLIERLKENGTYNITPQQAEAA
ncbi:MAG: 2OG-Fe(II) oxygenase family protein [Alphaproteobacteria bacterium]